MFSLSIPSSLGRTMPLGALLAFGLLLLVGCQNDATTSALATKSQAFTLPTVPFTLPEEPAIRPRPPVLSIRTVPLGKSVLGHPIEMVVFGPPATKAAIQTRPTFVFAGIHGEEQQAAATAESLIDHLRQTPSLYRDRQVAVLSRANPDGLAKHRRVNEHGVDLNRNFPARNFHPTKKHGQFPACEPETQALLAAIAQLNPGRIVSIHTCRAGRHGNNWDGKGKSLAEAMGRHNHYRCFGVWHNETPGSFGSWAGVDRALAVATLEIPNDRTDAQAWSENRDALLAAIAHDLPASGK